MKNRNILPNAIIAFISLILFIGLNGKVAFCQDQSLTQEKKIKVSGGPITEEDQQVVDELTEGVLVTPNNFQSRSGAIKYLRILLKGDHNSFRFFQGLPNEQAKTYYGEAIASALSVIGSGNKDVLDLTGHILKTKQDYPVAIAEAARHVADTNDKRIIPLLQQLVNNPALGEYRCEVANALLDFGDADSALPVLKELIDKEAYYEAFSDLFIWGIGGQIKIKDERGYAILENALDNGITLARIEAASFLYKAKKISKQKAQETAIRIISVYKPMKSYGLMYDPKSQYKTDVILDPKSIVADFKRARREWSMDQRAYRQAIILLGDLNAKDGIPVLQKFAQQVGNDSSLAKDAERMIAYLNEKCGAVSDQTEESAVSKLASIYEGKFLYDGNTRYYNGDDVDSKELKLDPNLHRLYVKTLRNEIYARNGRIFTTQDMKKIFENAPWYTPRLDFNESDLNDIERKNVEFLSAFEKKQGWK
jgi:hypothetical protein